MTYEHGKADADAPVTWSVGHGHYSGKAEMWIDGRHVAVDRWTAEHVCRAFHLAKLAEEAAGFVDLIGFASAEDHHDAAQDWLRRYRAAKGEA